MSAANVRLRNITLLGVGRLRGRRRGRGRGRRTSNVRATSGESHILRRVVTFRSWFAEMRRKKFTLGNGSHSSSKTEEPRGWGGRDIIRHRDGLSKQGSSGRSSSTSPERSIRPAGPQVGVPPRGHRARVDFLEFLIAIAASIIRTCGAAGRGAAKPAGKHVNSKPAETCETCGDAQNYKNVSTQIPRTCHYLQHTTHRNATRQTGSPTATQADWISHHNAGTGLHSLHNARLEPPGTGLHSLHVSTLQEHVNPNW